MNLATDIALLLTIAQKYYDSDLGRLVVSWGRRGNFHVTVYPGVCVFDLEEAE